MNRQLFTLMALLGLLPGFGLAQSADTETLPLYDVELVIFKNLKAPKSREFVLPVSSPSKDKNILDLSSVRSIAAANKLGYVILPDQQFRLTEAVRKLVKSSRYELLLHTAWRQPGRNREQALPVWIRGGRVFGSEYTSIDDAIELQENAPGTNLQKTDGTIKEFNEQTLEALELQQLEQQSKRRGQGLYELEGKITVALSRYLHLYTDLVLRRPRQSIDPVLNSSVQERPLATYSADTRILNNHILREHRRMRSKNLHYLDNPEFGMLVLITPYEVPEDFEEAPLETESTTAE